jgi:hypothetical protein
MENNELRKLSADELGTIISYLQSAGVREEGIYVTTKDATLIATAFFLVFNYYAEKAPEVITQFHTGYIDANDTFLANYFHIDIKTVKDMFKICELLYLFKRKEDKRSRIMFFYDKIYHILDGESQRVGAERKEEEARRANNREVKSKNYKLYMNGEGSEEDRFDAFKKRVVARVTATPFDDKDYSFFSWVESKFGFDIGDASLLKNFYNTNDKTAKCVESMDIEGFKRLKSVVAQKEMLGKLI